mmetsp:Transcript_38630/g.32628  ORF Transcript_38630/g.32628 Transcript_38630/m.32628 type:complete len:320 (-) Transcript_38630:42-1001(-)
MHRAAVEEWLQTDPEARAFFSNLLQAHFLRVPNEEGIIEEVKHKIPMLGRRSKLLRDEHLWVISGFINDNCLRRPWKRLYCSVRHGQSFSRFMSRMIFKGPTVMVIKDKAGCIFGAHAPLSWHKDNKFYGDAHTFLFTAAPKTEVYPVSGHNQNYMWLSTGLTSCSNGCGMGGQKDYWGLFLDSALEHGVCRAPCSTFAASMPCLASSPEFQIDQVEVWGCIPGYQPDERELEAAGVKRKQAKTFEEYQAKQSSKGAKSSLDSNLEARAIMQAAGIGGQSEDIRMADAAMETQRKATRVMAGEASESEDSSADETVEYD